MRVKFPFIFVTPPFLTTTVARSTPLPLAVTSAFRTTRISDFPVVQLDCDQEPRLKSFMSTVEWFLKSRKRTAWFSFGVATLEMLEVVR